MKRSPSISAPFGDAIAMLAGTTITRIGLTGAHKSFVRPSFGPFLVVSGLLIAVVSSLRLVGVLKRSGHEHNHDEGDRDGHGHEHREHSPGEREGDDGVGGHGREGRMPLVTLAFLLPALAFFLAGSATLGSYAAGRNGTTAMVQRVFPPLEPARGGLYFLSLGDVVERHAYGPTTDIVGRKLRLIGFVSRDEESPVTANSFTLTRFRILCCAADGIAMRVNVVGDEKLVVPPVDSWVEVVATFVDPSTPVPQNGRFDRPVIRPLSVKVIKRPEDPFE